MKPTAVVLLVMLVVSLLVAACGTYAASSTTLVGAPSASLATSTSAPSPTTTMPLSARPTIRDPGVTTTSTPPSSVPALASGITTDQMLELVADRSRVAPADWELRAHETWGDWAVANLYTRKLSEQMNEETGVAAVFEKKDEAWFQAGWVSLSDAPHQQVIELTNMGAPAEVWRYFGLDPASLPKGRAYPPEQPADFEFVADYGVAGRNRLDTSQGLFFKDLGPEEDRASTKLVLSPDVIESLYHDLAMIEI